MQATIVAIVLSLWGAGTSYLQERFGSYEKLKPRTKHVINLVVNLVLPSLVAVVQPYWKAEFGNAEQFLTSLLLILAPVAVWLVSQVTHQIDKKLSQ